MLWIAGTIIWGVLILFTWALCVAGSDDQTPKP